MSFISKHKDKWAKNRVEVAGKSLGGGVKAAPVLAGVKKLVNEFTLLCKTISQDQNTLRTKYVNHPERNAATPPFLDKYRDYCKAALKLNKPDEQDPIIVQCAIWAANCAEFAFASDLATLGKAMASGMQRNLPHLVFDSVMQDDRATDEDHLSILKLVDEEVWEINHAARAKLFKWAAYHFEKSDLSKACGYAEKAHETYPNVGVKTFMESLQKQLSSGTDAAAKPSAAELKAVAEAEAVNAAANK